MNAAAGLDVLVVEDDEATAELERRALARAGYSSRVVNRVDAAKALLQQEPFLAVLLDYQLPDGSPWEVLELARAAKPRIPVVLVTAMGNEHLVAEALHRGISDYVRKSGSFLDDLGEVVGRIAGMAQAEDRLRRSEALFQLIGENAGDILTIFDPVGTVSYVSSACRPLLGYEMTELMGIRFQDLVHPDDRAGTLFGQALTGPELHHRRDVFRCRRKDGTYVWVESELQLIRDQGSGVLSEVIGVTRDISERVTAQQKIEAALKEKTVLLNEVHHRVKNNLQIVSSLLMLQSTCSNNPAVQAVLKESQGRIKAMALTHQFLYEQGTFSKLDLGGYLECLGRLVEGIYGGGQRGISLHIDPPARQIWLAFDQAIPCGLLVSELLTNAFKHAFPQGRTGQIRVGCHLDHDNWINLSVVDDGLGLPPGFSIEQSKSLGLQLAATLVEQLQGTLQSHSRSGASFELRFPCREEQAHGLRRD